MKRYAEGLIVGGGLTDAAAGWPDIERFQADGPHRLGLRPFEMNKLSAVGYLLVIALTDVSRDIHGDF